MSLIMFSLEERIFRAWIYFSFLTRSRESNLFFMHLIATCLPFLRERAVKTTEKVPLPFSYYNLYWSISFIDYYYKNLTTNSATQKHFIFLLSHLYSYSILASKNLLYFIIKNLAMFNFSFQNSQSKPSGLWFTFFTQGNLVYKDLPP